MALDISFRQQESTRRQRSLHQAVQTLEHRVAWMNLLMNSTQKLVSTLSSDELTGRLEIGACRRLLPHHSGYLELEDTDAAPGVIDIAVDEGSAARRFGNRSDLSISRI